MVSCE